MGRDFRRLEVIVDQCMWVAKTKFRRKGVLLLVSKVAEKDLKISVVSKVFQMHDTIKG